MLRYERKCMKCGSFRWLADTTDKEEFYPLCFHYPVIPCSICGNANRFKLFVSKFEKEMESVTEITQ